MLTNFGWLIAAVCGGWFVASFMKEPRRLRNGVLLVAAVAAGVLALLSTPTAVTSVVLGVGVIVIAVGYVALVLFLLVNGVLVVVREGRSLATLLPLAAGVVVVLAPALIIWAVVGADQSRGIALPALAFFVFGFVGYLGFIFVSFVVYGLLYRARVGAPQSAVVLILGSRIINNRVPPLLAARLDRARRVYDECIRDGKAAPILICCGGKGSDEVRPEGEAMADYLVEHGIPATNVRVENKSTTTRENLVFGNEIAKAERPGEPLLISTNDFHTFRTALLSRELGLDAKVVPARTAHYYLPAAFLREFAAILRGYLWFHASVLGAFLVFVIALVWESLQMR